MLRTDRLRTVRQQRGLSQSDLARLCGLSINQMNRYEQGLSDPSTTILTTIADELKVSTDYLLGRSDLPQGYVNVENMRADERKLIEAYTIGDGTTLLKLMYERLQKLSPDRDKTAPTAES